MRAMLEDVYLRGQNRNERLKQASGKGREFSELRTSKARDQGSRGIGHPAKGESDWRDGRASKLCYGALDNIGPKE